MAQESWQLNDPKMVPPPSLTSSPSSSPEVLPSPFIAADQLAGAQSPASALAGDSFAPELAGQPYPVTSVDESPNAMSTSQFYIAATSVDKSSVSITASVGPSHASALAGKPSAAELVGRLYSTMSVGESSFPSPSLLSSPLQTQTALSSFSTTAAAPNVGGRGLRCLTCRKRVGLAGFKCRCGGLFCPTHRYSDKHPCSFDYKAAGREAIAKANPLIKATKITKI